MGRRFVPVIATNAETGEETRFETMAAAAKAVGGRGCLVHRACMNDRAYRGFFYRREDDWVLPRGGEKEGK